MRCYRLLIFGESRAICTKWRSLLTLETVGPIAELQAKDIVRGSVGVQSPSDLPAADEAVLSPQHNDGPVDQLHQELLRLSYREIRYMNIANMVTLNSLLIISDQLDQRGTMLKEN